jgi:Redoxin
MIPHERSLVKKLEGKPFALVGVNSDPDRFELRRACKARQITWRMWFDGGAEGPIATHWNVHSWPTLYVLDAKGVIRYKDVTGEELEKAVDTLLAEMAKGGK